MTIPLSTFWQRKLRCVHKGCLGIRNWLSFSMHIQVSQQQLLLSSTSQLLGKKLFQYLMAEKPSGCCSSWGKHGKLWNISTGWPPTSPRNAIRNKGLCKENTPTEAQGNDDQDWSLLLLSFRTFPLHTIHTCQKFSISHLFLLLLEIGTQVDTKEAVLSESLLHSLASRISVNNTSYFNSPRTHFQG